MASDVQVVANWRRSPVRLLMWGVAVFLLALPAVAMQFTPQVQWGPLDFATMGALLAFACGAVEMGARMSGNRAYRAGVGLAVLTGFLLIWANLAVGVVGHDGNPANLMFAGVLAIAVGGALIARGEAYGMAVAMGAAALAQVGAHVVAYAGDLGSEEPNTRGLVLFIGLGFAAMWAASAVSFRIAAPAS